MYSFVHEGIIYEVCILDTYNDYVRLIYKDDNCVYYITKWRVFVLKGWVFAKGNLRDVWNVDPVHILDYVETRETKRKINLETRPTEEIKKENPEWFAETKTERSEVLEIEKIESMGFKTADTNKSILELSVPTADELDSYFSSIGLEIPGGNF